MPYGMNPFQSVLDALQTAKTDSDEKSSELRELIGNVEDAIGMLDDYSENLDVAIEAITSLTDLSVSYTFDYSADDFDLSPDLNF